MNIKENEYYEGSLYTREVKRSTTGINKIMNTKIIGGQYNE